MLLSSCTVNQPNTESLTEAVELVEYKKLSKLGLAALDRFQNTWNTRNVATWSKSLHFPHVRPSAGEFDIYPTAADYIHASRDVFQGVLALGWHRSQWDRRQILHASSDKIHIAGEYTRWRENGEKISSQQVAYIVARQGDFWGIQSRCGTGKISIGDETSLGTEPALEAVKKYFVAFNSMDPQAWADTLHYPQVRLSASGLDIWKTRDEFLAGAETALQRTWFQTRIKQAETIQDGADDANVVVCYNRLNSEDELLSTYDAVFLVTKRDGNWAVQARSTFAP